MSEFMNKVRKFFSATDEYHVNGDSMADSVTNVTEVSQGTGRSVSVQPKRRNVSKSEIVIVKAQDYRNDDEMINDIADALYAGKSVIANMTDSDKRMRSRVIDFASGMVYMVDGHVNLIGQFIYMFSTRDLSVTTKDNQQGAAAANDYDYVSKEQVRYRQAEDYT